MPRTHAQGWVCRELLLQLKVRKSKARDTDRPIAVVVVKPAPEQKGLARAPALPATCGNLRRQFVRSAKVSQSIRMLRPEGFLGCCGQVYRRVETSGIAVDF
jgi:hypothetical protein